MHRNSALIDFRRSAMKQSIEFRQAPTGVSLAAGSGSVEAGEHVTNGAGKQHAHTHAHGNLWVPP